MAKKKIHIEKRLDKDNLIVDVQFVKGSIAPEWFQAFEKRNNARFDNIESRIDKIESRMDKIEFRIDKIESRINNIENVLKRNKLN